MASTESNVYVDGKGVMAMSEEKETVQQQAAAYREMTKRMQEQQAIDTGELQGRGKLLQEMQARKDAEARANNALLSQTESSIYARQGQEVPIPSYGSSIKNAISKLFSGRSSNEEGLSHTFANDNVRSIAASEEAKFNAQQNIPAQEADRLRNY